MRIPSEGSKWKHRNGTEYTVVFLTNELSVRTEYPVTIVYKNTHTGTMWSRPLDDWYRSMTPVEQEQE